MPVIGIIVPTHNRKALLPETLSSIMDQSCRAGWSFHAVVVDDGSNDDTFETLCRSYGKRKSTENIVTLTPQLTIIRRENGERGTARNTGVRWAVANVAPDWLIFVDSDDVLTKNAFRHLTDRLGENPAADIVAVHGVINVWNGKAVVDSFPRTTRSVEGYVSDAIVRRPVMSLGASLIRSKTFLSLGGFSERREISGSEDWILLLRVALRGRVLFVPQVITYYRQHRGENRALPSLDSKDLAVRAMIPDIVDHFGQTASNALRMLYRQAEFKKVGALNSQGFWKQATRVLCRTIIRDHRTWGDYRLYRLSLSIAKTIYHKFTNHIRYLFCSTKVPVVLTPQLQRD